MAPAAEDPPADANNAGEHGVDTTQSSGPNHAASTANGRANGVQPNDNGARNIPNTTGTRRPDAHALPSDYLQGPSL